MAAEMISGFRRNNGRGPLTVDPVLMAVAEAQAAAMTQADQVGVRTGTVGARLTTPAIVTARRWRTPRPAISPSPRPFPAGAIRRRTAPTC